MQKLKKRMIRQQLLLLIMLAVFSVAGIQVQAEGEQAAFGSEEYEWELGAVSPIGIYARAAQNISSAELHVYYDEEMLEYVSGGTLQEVGHVVVSASEIGAEEYKEMLEFEPISGGKTEVVIAEGTIVNELGETVSAAEVRVGVTIPSAEGSTVEGISVNGVAIEGFVENIFTYNMEVTEDIEDVLITVLPEGQQIEVPDSALVVGENEITVFAYNESGERTKYLLNITRPEPAPEVVEEPVEVQQEPTVIVEKEEKAVEFEKILSIVLIVLAVIWILLLFILIRKMQKNRRRKRRRKKQAARVKRLAAEVQNPVKEKVEVQTQVKENVEAGVSAEIVEKAEIKVGGVNPDDDREVEISVRNVTMEFKHEKDESTSIKEMAIRTLKGQRSYEMFKALDDISFDIYKGEVVGIIGTNGSGKSTILKIISGALQPTQGHVEVDKQKIQLLTLGTGFDYELTGKENVYLNGSIIGYTKEYIDEKYDEIVKFAELEGFMEEKVRNYSSGMVSRLGFAIATIRNTPEILILDEVLSVGDMFFRKKSEARIKEMMHGGSTVLIVSHSPSVIRANCNKAVWIEKGVLRAVGDPKDVCAMYEKMNNPS